VRRGIDLMARVVVEQGRGRFCAGAVCGEAVVVRGRRGGRGRDEGGRGRVRGEAALVRVGPGRDMTECGVGEAARARPWRWWSRRSGAGRGACGTARRRRRRRRGVRLGRVRVRVQRVAHGRWGSRLARPVVARGGGRGSGSRWSKEAVNGRAARAGGVGEGGMGAQRAASAWRGARECVWTRSLCRPGERPAPRRDDEARAALPLAPAFSLSRPPVLASWQPCALQVARLRPTLQPGLRVLPSSCLLAFPWFLESSSSASTAQRCTRARRLPRSSSCSRRLRQGPSSAIAEMGRASAFVLPPRESRSPLRRSLSLGVCLCAPVLQLRS